MASIRERTSKSGVRTWQVLYRHGGKQPSRTFGDPVSAEKFKSLVNLLGPDGAFAALEGEPEAGITVRREPAAGVAQRAGHAATHGARREP